MPIFPALALLVGCYLETASRRQRMLAASIVTLLGVAIMIVVPQVPGLVGRPGEMDLIRAYQPWVLAASMRWRRDAVSR